jgi:hypothetical protein
MDFYAKAPARRPGADLTDLLPDVWRGTRGVPTTAVGR